MYRASIILDLDVIKARREAAQAAPGAMVRYVNEVVKPDTLRQVNEQLAPYPGPVVYPFEFATAKSRRYYFWAFKGKIPYQRTFRLQQSWFVKTDNRRNEGFIQFGNSAPMAVYVYGPGFLLTNRRQVPGHANTGWGADFERKIIEISERENDLIITGWYEIVTGQRT